MWQNHQFEKIFVFMIIWWEVVIYPCLFNSAASYSATIHILIRAAIYTQNFHVSDHVLDDCGAVECNREG